MKNPNVKKINVICWRANIFNVIPYTLLYGGDNKIGLYSILFIRYKHSARIEKILAIIIITMYTIIVVNLWSSYVPHLSNDNPI